MFFSHRIVEDDDYLRSVLHSCAEDRPLIVQICGNCPETMAAAAKQIEDYCNTSLHGLDAIDINLGCPQKRAQEGHYGSYLLDRRDWELVEAIVASMAAAKGEGGWSGGSHVTFPAKGVNILKISQNVVIVVDILKIS